MKFIKLESRGGNYLVVAENVAWLRVAENGQTSVGIIGGQPLLVVGSPEEIAAKLLEATGAEDEQQPQAAAAAPAATAASAPLPAAPPEAQPASQAVAEPAAAPALQPAPKPAPAIVNLSLRSAPATGGASLSERLAAARPKAQRVAGAAE